MKLIIISDIHGGYENILNIKKFIDEFNPDTIILLGDILYDYQNNFSSDELADILNHYKNKIIGVQGNCDSLTDQIKLDFNIMNDYITFNIEDDIRIYCTHGHLNLNIPSNVIKISGHTHRSILTTKEINPGSITYPRDGNKSFIAYDNRKFTLYDINLNIIDELSI